MAAYKTGAFVRSKYYTPFLKTPLKWIPRSKSGASKSRPRWAAHTRIGNVWEYSPAGIGVMLEFKFIERGLLKDSVKTSNLFVNDISRVFLRIEIQ